MAGIYIHIPFCASKCSYCDFYSVIPLSKKKDLVNAIVKELHLRSQFIQEPVETIYFGGGTPSVLEPKELESIMASIHQHYTLSDILECTFEANPEHITSDYVKDIQGLGINRLSMGTQSFDDDILKFLKRSHQATQAIKAVETAYSNGLSNISIDLIYAIPGLSLKQWKEQLKIALDLPIKHLSSYHLTYEEGTPLYRQLRQKRFQVPNDQLSESQFFHLFEYSSQKGFPYYEISNFAEQGFYSKHNSAYWLQKNYLGIGPSAHSYNGISRNWNISNLKSYLNALENDKCAFEEEILSPLDMLNEYIITHLRTRWGIDLKAFSEQFGSLKTKALQNRCAAFLQSEDMIQENNQLTLSLKGLLKSDLIMENLFFLE